MLTLSPADAHNSCLEHASFCWLWNWFLLVGYGLWLPPQRSLPGLRPPAHVTWRRLSAVPFPWTSYCACFLQLTSSSVKQGLQQTPLHQPRRRAGSCLTKCPPHGKRYVFAIVHSLFPSIKLQNSQSPSVLGWMLGLWKEFYHKFCSTEQITGPKATG